MKRFQPKFSHTEETNITKLNKNRIFVLNYFLKKTHSYRVTHFKRSTQIILKERSKMKKTWGHISRLFPFFKLKLFSCFFFLGPLYVYRLSAIWRQLRKIPKTSVTTFYKKVKKGTFIKCRIWNIQWLNS